MYLYVYMYIQINYIDFTCVWTLNKVSMRSLLCNLWMGVQAIRAVAARKHNVGQVARASHLFHIVFLDTAS